MISFDEAYALAVGAALPLPTELLALDQAAGHVLAENVRARIDSPRADSSAMDGYAVRDADLRDLPARLAIVARSYPGQQPLASLAPGQCVRVFTGAAVPAGANMVVIQEMVLEEGQDALFAQACGPARHIRRRGSDFAQGDSLLEAGRVLDARALVAVAAADVAEIKVHRRPLVNLLSTGDELVSPGQASDTAGMIPESISVGVAALAEQWGGKFGSRLRLADDLCTMRKAAATAVAEADVVVVTGGASVGERDFAKRMFEGSGFELIFSKAAIKPGKPVWLGRAGGRLVLGLPGNPTSALVTARLFFAPLIAALSGRNPAEAAQWRKVSLGAPLEACGDRETFVRARRSGETALPLANQESNAQRTLAQADVLIRRRPNAAPAAAGDMVEIIDF